jgi:hypothetical protein
VIKLKGNMKGDGIVSGNLRKRASKYPDRVGSAMYQEMSIEATEMKRRTPVDTTPNAPHPGNLRNSIHVEQPEQKGRMISVTVATGAQAPYAIHVHENPDAFHPIGQWKFMESVLNESRTSMGKRIAARVKLNDEKEK